MSVTVNHVVLALSSASAFFVCYVGSQLLSSLLNDAGYDPFRTLLGLEQQPENMSSPLIKDFSTNQFAQLLAIALTAVTTVVLFLKFSKSMSIYPNVRDETDTRLQSRRNRYWIPRTGKNFNSEKRPLSRRILPCKRPRDQRAFV